MDKTLRNWIVKNTFIWWIGWLSLGVIEISLSLIFGSNILMQMCLFTLFIYSLVGIISSFICAAFLVLLQRSVNPEQHSNLTHFSMAACIATIVFFYSLVFFSDTKLLFSSPVLIFNRIAFFVLSMVLLCLLPSFFQWINTRGSSLASYLALLPSLWIVTSLKFNRDQGLLPPFFQKTTFSHIILLILGSALCFFLVYGILSVITGFFRRRGRRFLVSIISVGASCLCLVLLLFFLLQRGGSPDMKSEVKNVPIGKPNILLISMDAARADHLSCYGYRRPTTPNLDSIAREGTLFRNAYATTSWTLPSHASMFTGLYPTRHGANHRTEPVARRTGSIAGEDRKDLPSWEEVVSWSFSRLSEEHLTLAEILSERGYRTAGIIGGVFCTSVFGLDQGFGYYDDEIPLFNFKYFLFFQLVDRFLPLNDLFTQFGYFGKRTGGQLNASAFRWLERNHDQPFFLFIHYMDSHTPYLPPSPYDEYFGKVDKGIVVNNRNLTRDLSSVTAVTNLAFLVNGGAHRLTPDEKELIVSLYDDGLRYLDHCLGILFEKLKTLNVYDNTLIIITSDHGEAFGEHNQIEHGLSLYEEVLRVPLIIKYPSSDSRRGVIEERVSLADLFPTVLSLLEYPIPPGIDGEVMGNSDRPLIAELIMGIAQKYHKGSGDLRAVYQEKEKYIWASNGSNELYDLEKDPQEEDNLVKKFPHRVEAMETVIREWLALFEPVTSEGEHVKINKSTEEKLRALGYLK